MDIDKHHEPSIDAHSDETEFTAATPKSNISNENLSLASKMLGSFKQVQSLSQLVQSLTQTLPSILGACGCGYLTWVQSPRMGIRWESVIGNMGRLMEKAVWGIDISATRILKSEQYTICNLTDGGTPKSIAALMRQTKCTSLLLIPINLEGDIRGTLMLGREQVDPSWTEEEAAAGFEMVELAVSMYTTRNNLAKAQKHILELERVFTASLDLTATLDPENVLHNILKNALSINPNANDAHIFYYDGKILSFGAALFRDGSTGQAWSLPRDKGLTYTVARTGEMVVVEDMHNHPLYQNTPASWKGAIVGMPLKMKDGVIGVMTLALLEPHTFDDVSLRQLQLLADQAGIALQNARLHNLIREEAHTDWLTGLPNRRAFELTIAQMIEKAHILEGKFTLMMLDLDHFKSINDEYGHRIGDEALRRIALRLKESVRKTDYLARIGGDEFAIIFPETSLEEAYAIGIKLQQQVSGCDLRLPDGKLGCVSISLGLANYPQTGKTAEELLETADAGLYVDKDND